MKEKYIIIDFSRNCLIGIYDSIDEIEEDIDEGLINIDNTKMFRLNNENQLRVVKVEQINYVYRIKR
jgi:hypothetical protein